MWMEGSIDVDEHAIYVEPLDGKRRQGYKLFDHVTVTIQLSNNSDVHARSLAFYLLSKRSWGTEAKSNLKHGNTADDIQISKMDFLQAIKNDQEKVGEMSEKNKSGDVTLEDDISNQKNKFSMYRFFEEMRNMGETQIAKS